MEFINKTSIISIIIITIVFLALDFMWFIVSVPNLYKPLFEKIQKEELELRLLSGLYAWTLLALSVYYFVLPKSNDVYEAGFYGALMGLIIYGVYNGTNYATFKDWTMTAFLFDNLWGIIVTSLTSVAAYKLLK
jgi:uncharacterized membrane protein